MSEPASASAPTRTLLGKGRSGVVFRQVGRDGSQRAVKVFYSKGLARIVHYLLSGAPNPYAWCKHAVRCAFARRRILSALVQVWFGERVRIANAIETGFDDATKSFELHMELIDGRPATLHHPFSAAREAELRELVDEVMRPLIAHLIASGFEGLVWQAGLGNPVAASNFLCEERRGEERVWVWVDAESGVPALFPLNPLTLLGFYLPKSIKHRRPLFDDVDSERLAAYVDRHAEALRDQLGGPAYRELCAACDELAEEQRAWRAIPRFHRAIEYQRCKGRLTSSQAERFRKSAARWYAREMFRLPASAARAAWRACKLTLGRLIKVPLWRMFVASLRFLVSAEYRDRLSREHVAKRIERWRKRKQLTEAESIYLRRRIMKHPTPAYVTDFGMHLALKPLVKLITWLVVPLLAVQGLIDVWWVALSVSAGGSVARTVYTLGRLLQSVVRSERKPWLALLVGTIPVVGNAAYATQLVYESSSRSRLASFILFDLFAVVGERVPIWGGQDTRTEHLFNRLPALVAPFRQPLSPSEIRELGSETPARI